MRKKDKSKKEDDDGGEAILLPPIESPMSVENFQKTYHYQEEKANYLQDLKSKLSCSKNCIFSFIPILRWLPKYDWRKNLLDDIVAGLTVSVLQVPHGLAFAPLGGQEPVVGLYMAVFPIIMYVILGTSRHISLGMMGILIMMVGKVVDTHSSVLVTAGNTTVPEYSPLEVAIALSFTMGLWQLFLGCLQLGFLSVLLSNCMISGLTAGASIHIVYLQLRNLFGIPLVITSGPFKLVYATIELVKMLPVTNIATLVVAVSVMVVLYSFNEYVRGYIAKKCRLPIPIEFVLIFLGIGLSVALDLPNTYGVRTVGEVPSGLPIPMAPPFSLIPKIAFDGFVLALINISFNISLAKLFAKKGGYELGQNQELLAYGACNIFGSFFQSLPVSASFSRSAIQFEVGGKTELTHLVSLLSVLFILLGLGPLFANIPLSVLAAIVIVTVKGLIMQISEFPKYWRMSKLDGGVWMITFVTVLAVDIDYGIGIGLAASVGSLIILAVQSEVEVLGQTSGKSCFISNQTYPEAEEKPKVLILKLSGGFQYVNGIVMAQKIKSSLARLWSSYPNLPTCLIVDFEATYSIDPAIVEQFSSLLKILEENSCALFITGCSKSVYSTFERCDFFSKNPEENMIVDIEHALKYIEDTKLLG